MNNHTRKRNALTISATVLGAALLMSSSVSVTYAANNVPAAPNQTVAAVAVKPSSDAVRLTFKKVEKSTDQLETDLEVPIISGMKDAAYQNTLNANIAARAKAAVDVIAKQAADDMAANDGSYEFRPYGVTIKYELLSDGSAASGGVLSFKVYTYTYTGGAHGGTFVETYNVRNATKASPIKLKELFGSDFKRMINHAVKAEIAVRPDEFFADTFKSIADNQAFYIQGGIAYIIFQQYEIAPYAAGMPEIAVVIPETGVSTVPAGAVKLPLVANSQNVKGVKLYKTPGGTLMAPLRMTAEALGYNVDFNTRTHQAEIRKSNDWAKVTRGKNRYAVADMASFTLGAAPAIKNGTMYVPISFFTTVLKADLAYTKQAVLLTSPASK